jgi:hypothetical protein
MSLQLTEEKINPLVVLVKLQDTLKLFKLDSFDRKTFYEQHKLVYPYLEKENVHCFDLPFLDISMLSKDFKNYDKLVLTLSDLTNLQYLMKKYNNTSIGKFFKDKNDVKEEVPPANNFDNVMEIKDFDNKFLDSNKKSYYVYLNNENFKAYLFDMELNMSYFPELEYVNTLELDVNLYNKYNDILNESLFYNKDQLLDLVGNNSLSFSNLKDRFNLLFEKDNNEKMRFDDILNNIIIIDDVLKDTKLLSFYKSSLKKILELNQVERNFDLYLLKLKHSNNIISAKNLLKMNENNTEAIPVDIFNETLETTINNRDALKVENTSEINIIEQSKLLLEIFQERIAK